MSIGLVKLFEHTSSMLSTLCSLAWNTSLADTPTACSRGTRDVCFHKPTPLFIVRHIVTNRIARIWSLVKYPKLFPLCMSVVFLNSVASISHWHFCDHGSNEQVNKIALLNLNENFVSLLHFKQTCIRRAVVKRYPLLRWFGCLDCCWRPPGQSNSEQMLWRKIPVHALRWNTVGLRWRYVLLLLPHVGRFMQKPRMQ